MQHREACRIANCLDFIEKWDDGFDTVSDLCVPACLMRRDEMRCMLFIWLTDVYFHMRFVLSSQVIGERGAQLSGGQRARVALARYARRQIFEDRFSLRP